MFRYLACFAIALLLAGCAQNRTPGTVHQAAHIGPEERIAVLWTTGLFMDPYIHEQMQKDGTYGPLYEACTNAWIERTFRMNGYTVSARRIATGEKPTLPRDARYLLAITNPMARTTRRYMGGAPLGFGMVILEMEVDLRDQASRKSLWTGNEAFFTDARKNAAAVQRIVRGLAADGYLARKPEEVVDYAGRINAEDDLPNCPG